MPRALLRPPGKFIPAHGPGRGHHRLLPAPAPLGSLIPPGSEQSWLCSPSQRLAGRGILTPPHSPLTPAFSPPTGSPSEMQGNSQLSPQPTRGPE